jgi:hypothetical protein
MEPCLRSPRSETSGGLFVPWSRLARPPRAGPRPAAAIAGGPTRTRPAWLPTARQQQAGAVASFASGCSSFACQGSSQGPAARASTPFAAPPCSARAETRNRGQQGAPPAGQHERRHRAATRTSAAFVPIRASMGGCSSESPGPCQIKLDRAVGFVARSRLTF